MKTSRRTFYFLVILIAWLPYWWAFFPVIVSYDGAAQLANFFGLSYPNNHQPYTAAAIMGVLIKFFMKLTNNNSTWSFALYAGLIGSCSAIVCSRLVVKFGTAFGRNIQWLSLLLFALFPLFPFYAFSYDKTAPFLIGIGMSFSALISIAIDKNLNNHLWELAIGTVVTSVFRSDGYYVMVIVLLACVVVLRSKQLLLCLISIIVLMTVITKVIFPMAFIAPGLPGDSISVPLQQVAYTVKTHEAQLKGSKLYDDLNKIMPLKKITEVYNPNLADYVKFNYGNTYNNENKSKKEAFETFLKERSKYGIRNFLKLWLRLGMKYPFDYVKAWIYQVDSYYSPTNDNEQEKSSGQLFMNLNQVWVQNRITDIMRQLNFSVDYNGSEFAKKFKNRLLTPLHNNNIIYKIFLSAWLYDWLLIISSLVLLVKMIRKNVSIVWGLPFLLPLGVLGVAMLTPVDGGMRYILPVIMALPMCIAVIFDTNHLNIKDKNREII
ncbi:MULTISPECIES: DUF6020 family protein [Leuconostoc gelidum group]|uniref:Integral membrane protein n=1 Tax=Leuconostoc gelidum subsp. gelidum TaxID=1607839 RepID=A0AB35G1Y7_LEUGE|nr:MULTISPECIES: DUF6020 family protein [Leuconostoc gelidum group]MBZ5960319.1 hypothetical protein [Leuconostoc gasicomitatum]MBZ5968824.1 hypothetical protein [Leuconostoc gasicomitatum]MBZ6016779.1 hypothetical protein [Leuconostoc gelidum subsp. gelidum]